MNAVKLSLFFLLFHIPVFGGPFAWNAAWQEVEESRAGNQPQEAIKRTMELELRGVRDGAWNHVLRAVLTRYRIECETFPERQKDLLSVLRVFTEETPVAVRPLLSVVVAHLFWEYFLQHSNDFLSRPQPNRTADLTNDFSQWSLPRFIIEIDRLFATALNAESALKAVPLAQFADLLDLGDHQPEEIPTLYDWILRDRIRFCALPFANPFPRTHPSFEITAEGFAFEPAEIFQRLIPSAGENPPRLLEALHLFKDLIRFHQKEKRETALAAVDLERLLFCRQHATGNDIETPFQNALDQWMSKWRRLPLSARAAALRAAHEVEQGRFGIAHLIAGRGMAGLPDTEPGVRQCQSWIKRLEATSYSFKTERLWGAPLPEISVTYRNLRELNFRIIPLAASEMITPKLPVTNADKQSRLLEFLKKAPIRAWATPLPAAPDFAERSHRFTPPHEIPSGAYLLVASDTPDFDPEKGHVTTAQINVTTLSALLFLHDGQFQKGFVQRAKTGAGISGASVQLWIQENPTNATFTCRRVVRTGHAGLFTFDTPFTNAVLSILYGRERLWIEQPLRKFPAPRVAPAAPQAFLLTDKTYYAPGESIHFFGIPIQAGQPKRNVHILTEPTRIPVALSSNDTSFHTQQLCHATGFFTGSFHLPTTSARTHTPLTLSAPGSTLSLHLYQTPPLRITLDAPTPEPRLGALLSLRGQVLDPQNHPIPQTYVQWKVARGKKGEEPTTLLTENTTMTDADGTFLVAFLAQKPAEPATQWNITLHATMTNGATGSLQKTLSIPESPWKPTLHIPAWHFSTSPVPFTVQLKTHTGTPLSANGRLSIHAIRTPAAPQMPDTPHLSFTEEREMLSLPTEKWKTGTPITSETIRTDPTGIAKGTVPLRPGIYRLRFEAQDPFGVNVRTESTVCLFDPNAKRCPIPLPFLLLAEKWRHTPGETFRLTWGTGYANGSVRIEFWQANQLIGSWENPRRTTFAQLDLPITEEMRGGITLRAFFTRNNHCFTFTKTIEVPWTGFEISRPTDPIASSRMPQPNQDHGFQWISALYSSDRTFFKENVPTNGFAPFFRKEKSKMDHFLFSNRLANGTPLRERTENGKVPDRIQEPTFKGILPFLAPANLQYATTGEKTPPAEEPHTEGFIRSQKGAPFPAPHPVRTRWIFGWDNSLRWGYWELPPQRNNAPKKPL